MLFTSPSPPAHEKHSKWKSTWAPFLEGLGCKVWQTKRCAIRAVKAAWCLPVVCLGFHMLHMCVCVYIYIYVLYIYVNIGYLAINQLSQLRDTILNERWVNWLPKGVFVSTVKLAVTGGRSPHEEFSPRILWLGKPGISVGDDISPIVGWCATLGHRNQPLIIRRDFPDFFSISWFFSRKHLMRIRLLKKIGARSLLSSSLAEDPGKSAFLEKGQASFWHMSIIYSWMPVHNHSSLGYMIWRFPEIGVFAVIIHF